MADAFSAHDEALRYGGRTGVGSLHLIESALGRVYSGYHGPIANKAAAVLPSVVGNHRFVDGNKRKALLLVEILIDRSGYALNIPDDAPFDDLVVGVASGQIGFAALVVWFGERVVRAESG